MSSKVTPVDNGASEHDHGSETRRQLDPALQTQKDGKPRHFVRTRDKVMFVISVMNFMLLAFFTAGYQWLMPYYYTFVALPYIFLRMWNYGRGNYAYFLLDLCYWGNYLLLIYLWAPSYQYSEYLFACVYALASGPMSWAIIIFRNAMVFHSLDKSISNFIHLGPCLVVFAIRWHVPIAENYNNSDVAGHTRDVYPYNWSGLGRFKVCELDQPCFQEWWLWFFLVPCGAQLVWACMYPLATRVCCKIQPRHVDAFRYLTSKGGILQALGKWKNQKLAYFTYNVINYAADMLMTFPAALFYYNYYANLVFLAVLVVASIWNGGNFYIEVFAKRYLSRVEKIEQKAFEKQRQERQRKMRQQQENKHQKDEEEEEEVAESQEPATEAAHEDEQGQPLLDPDGSAALGPDSRRSAESKEPPALQNDGKAAVVLSGTHAVVAI